MNHCQICSKPAKEGDLFYSEKYSPHNSRKVNSCTRCLNLWLDEKYDELDKLIEIKIFGLTNKEVKE